MEVSTEAKLGLIMPAHPPSGNWHYQFRILLLGDSTVGKTSLLRRYTERCFIPTPCPTVGVEFYSKMMELPPGIKVKLQLWDTAGQERFRSFESIFDWYNEVTNVMDKVIFLLVGHKCDLESMNRVTLEEAEGLAMSLGTSFIETSAKTDTNIDLAFETITNAIYEALRNKEFDLQEGWDGVKIHELSHSAPPVHTHARPQTDTDTGTQEIAASRGSPSSSLPMAVDSPWDYQFRIIMLGDSTVGKSCLLKRYADGVFVESMNQTVGVDFYVHFLEMEPKLRFKLQFWDTAGQERFRSVTRSYYRNAAGGVLMFDLTNRASFENIRNWHQEVVDTVKPHHPVFVLVGNKSDLEAERKVKQREAEKLAVSLEAKYIETSAKSSRNVEAVFQMLTLGIYKALKSGVMKPGPQWDGVKTKLPSPVQPEVPSQEKRKTCSC
ncbi:hypothetical protein Chor_001576 [Crotalus horridus]